MIKFVIRDHLLRLTNAEWANLKRRFDPENAKFIGYVHKIRISCKLCARYRTKKGSCSACPFYGIFEHNNACMELTQLMFPAQVFNVNVKLISWNPSDNYTARRQLRSILRRMKKIEDSQKKK